MQKYRDVIFDVEQITAERWDWSVYAKIGGTLIATGSQRNDRQALKAAHVAIDSLIHEN